MDAAEAWLAQHDPDYESSRQSWRHLNTDGEYETPRQEIPWGDATAVARLVERGAATYTELSENERRCRYCDTVFVVWKSDHVYCSATCRQHDRPKRDRDRTDYQRELMRQRRAEQAATSWDLGVIDEPNPFRAA